MRVFLLVIFSLALLNSCKETPAPEKKSDVQEVLKKYDAPVKDFRAKVALLSEKHNQENKERAAEIIKLAKDLDEQIYKAENELIAQRKTLGVSEKPAELKTLRDELEADRQKAIIILSRIMKPELAKLAKANDKKLNNELKLIKNITVNDKVTDFKKIAEKIPVL